MDLIKVLVRHIGRQLDRPQEPTSRSDCEGDAWMLNWPR